MTHWQSFPCEASTLDFHQGHVIPGQVNDCINESAKSALAPQAFEFALDSSIAFMHD
jgi:hypothetical protein